MSSELTSKCHESFWPAVSPNRSESWALHRVNQDLCDSLRDQHGEGVEAASLGLTCCCQKGEDVGVAVAEHRARAERCQLARRPRAHHRRVHQAALAPERLTDSQQSGSQTCSRADHRLAAERLTDSQQVESQTCSAADHRLAAERIINLQQSGSQLCPHCPAPLWLRV